MPGARSFSAENPRTRGVGRGGACGAGLARGVRGWAGLARGVRSWAGAHSTRLRASPSSARSLPRLGAHSTGFVSARTGTGPSARWAERTRRASRPRGQERRRVRGGRSALDGLLVRADRNGAECAVVGAHSTGFVSAPRRTAPRAARYPRAASTRAEKIFRLGSSTRCANSGCHCTAQRKRDAGRHTASTTPSGASAMTSSPGATSRSAWWW